MKEYIDEQVDFLLGNDDLKVVDPGSFMKDQIVAELKTVYDPEMPSINVYDLGLIYDICICDRTDGHPVKDVDVTHTLTSMFCPMADEISDNIKQAVMRVEGIGVVTINLTHTPPFTREMMSEDAKLILGM